MRMFDVIYLACFGALLVAGAGCGSGAAQRQEAAIAELEAARADLREAEAELRALTEELRPLLKAASLLERSQAGLPGFDLSDAAERPTRRQHVPSERRALDAEIRATWDAGVRKLSERRFEVDRSVVAQAAAHPEVLARQARLLPNYREGQPAGLRIVGLRPGALLSHLGLKNGDMVREVNGRALTTATQLLDLHTELTQQAEPLEEVVVQVDRRGVPVSFTYVLVGGPGGPGGE